MIAAGSLNHRITIRAATTSVNEVGEQIESWTAVTSVWAQRMSLKLVEVNRMAGLDQAAEIKFRIRHRTDLTTLMEVEHERRRYRITSVEEVGNREATDLFVRAI
ncbi:phage head closure protein [Sphingomonas xinjiangensis]|uniref:SPP1 family predicted phage head-tail adaptor n=1 Tax=Sphingomonas xinjiangensis TaxID=643568 RepID=A0A840YK58_9SPHN|nr:SPP1 family predicted phage head-tail adaptor [Sphingomonas xinjiangensis]